MAKDQKNKQTPKVAEEDASSESDLTSLKGEESALATRSADEEEASGDASSSEEGGALARVSEGETEGTDAEEEEEVAAGHLGSARYVLSAFFAGGMLLAYILGKLIHSLWATLANKDWFSRALPAIAAVGDDDKMTYGTIVGGIIALVLVLRTYRNPEIRTWSDEVASELAKVKWPNKKEVTNSTFVVITATTVATLYLALLDRFWAFVTNIVYGDGS